MQEPTITIMAILKSAWALADDLHKDNIRFSTGDVDTPPRKPLQITVTEDSSLDEIFELGYGTIRVTSVLQAEVKVTVVDDTTKGPGIAKDNRFSIIKEIRRIIKANKTGLTDLDKVELRGRGRNINQLYRNPPVFGYIQKFLITYYE